MKILILIPAILLALPTFSADRSADLTANPFAERSAKQCISGEAGATNLIDQMKTATESSALTKIIYQDYQIGVHPTEAKAPATECKECDAENEKKRIAHLDKLPVAGAIPEAPQVIFKKECLAESGHFKSNTAEVTCPEGKKARNQNLCLTENLLEYQNAVISSFSGCMLKSGFKSMDSASLFKLYSLESAFKPQYAYNGGVGVGQLTRIFVEDVHQKHRGLKFLKAIANSNDKECNAAKIIASEDIKKKPQISNTCSFTSVGEGLERNILYTLVGLENSWEKDISPKFKAYNERYKNDPKLKEAQDLALLNGYGPGGRVAARAAVERLSSLPPEKFIAAIKKPMQKVRGHSLSIYINKMESRQKQLEKEFKEPLKSDFAERGAQACVN